MELPCYVKLSLCVHVRKIRACYGEKESRRSDCFLVMLELIHINCWLYYLCLLGDVPVLISEDIVISQPAKILNFLRKQVGHFQKICFLCLVVTLHVPCIHWYRLLKTWNSVQTQCFPVFHTCMRIAKWWITDYLKVWLLVMWKILKIGVRKLFIEKDRRLALIERFLTEHPALNYNTLNVIMALQT